MKKILMAVAVILCIPLLLGAISNLSNAISGGSGSFIDTVDIPTAPFYSLQQEAFTQDASGEVELSYVVDLAEISQLLSDGYEVTFGVLVGNVPRKAGALLLSGSFEEGYSLSAGVGEAVVFYCSDSTNQDIVNYPAKYEGDGRFTFVYKIPASGFLDGEGIAHRGFVTVYKNGEESVSYTWEETFTFWGGTAYAGATAPAGHYSWQIGQTEGSEPAWNCKLTFADVAHYTEQGYRVLVGTFVGTTTFYSNYSQTGEESSSEGPKISPPLE